MSETTGTIESSSKFVVVTPADNTLLKYNNQVMRTKAIFVGGAGNLAVKDDNGTAVTFTGIVAGSILPISTDTINSTNTTATNICALF